ncbi:hypothetical protein N0V90_005495 [Kalmusia sp. IMI 367209]|nr:hypothetical protein N0V90_005495 [Kalmusia sp. IMI 367209]
MSFIAKSAKDWVVKNPKTAALTAATPVIAVVAVPATLAAVEFGAGGVGAAFVATKVKGKAAENTGKQNSSNVEPKSKL